MSEVSLQHITKTYRGGTRAVTDFNLEIRDEEFLVLVGPSGCGKSTLLRLIAGLENADEGDIYIDGVRVTDASPGERDIAMVFQNYALYPHMSVYENMAFALRLQSVENAEIERRVRQTADLLEIGDLLERKPKDLSGGQRQRVAMGRAIVRSPRVFLMDEPLSNLDPQLRGQLRSLISRLHAQLGTTFIYVTHDQVEAMSLASRIVVMKEGIIQQVGTPQEVYGKPANTFVAGFIGSPAMNILDASVSDGYLYCGGIRVAVTPDIQGKIEAIDAGEGETTAVCVGVRPEDVRVSREAGGNMCKATVEVRELLGSMSVIHCSCDGVTVRALTDNVDLVPESTVYVSFDSSRLHLFHPDTRELLA